MIKNAFWKDLIRYDFIENYPFSLEELSVSYNDIRNLLVILREMILNKNTDYSLELDKNNITEIQNKLKVHRTAGLGMSLEDLSRLLSKKEYCKGGKFYKIFDFQEPQPYHKICGNRFPPKIFRACFFCHEIIVPQEIFTKNIYESMNSEFRQMLKCPKCQKKIYIRDLNCPVCNPQDLRETEFRKRLPTEDPKKAYVFPDQLGWTNPKIVFNRDFFNTILKGIELEQEVYAKLKNAGIPENKIMLSTRVSTGLNNGWGTEIDILFADTLQGKVKDRSFWILWAIEVKNQEAKVDKKTFIKFFEEVNQITPNLIIVSNGGFEQDVWSANANMGENKNMILTYPNTFENLVFGRKLW